MGFFSSSRRLTSRRLTRAIYRRDSHSTPAQPNPWPEYSSAGRDPAACGPDSRHKQTKQSRTALSAPSRPSASAARTPLTSQRRPIPVIVYNRRLYNHSFKPTFTRCFDRLTISQRNISPPPSAPSSPSSPSHLHRDRFNVAVENEWHQ